MKFWKKKAEGGIEFVKHLRAHLGNRKTWFQLKCVSLLDFFAGSIEGLSASADGFLLATTSSDHSVKTYDVINFGLFCDVKMRLCVAHIALSFSFDRHDEHEESGVRSLAV